MKKINRQALCEVVEIINNSEEKIYKKIPQSFMNFLYENMDNEYKVKIDFSEDTWKDNLLVDTKQIIALIYRDYIVSKEKQKELILKEKYEKIKKEKELAEKYNTYSLFKKDEVKKDLVENNQNYLPMEIKKDNIFITIWNKIINIFKR